MRATRGIKANWQIFSVKESWCADSTIERKFSVVLGQVERLEAAGFMPDEWTDVADVPVVAARFARWRAPAASLISSTTRSILG